MAVAGAGKLTCRIRCRTCCGHTAAPPATTQQWGSTSDLQHCPRHPMQPRAPAQPRFAAGMRRRWPLSQCPRAQACSWLQGRPPRRCARPASPPSAGALEITQAPSLILPARPSAAACVPRVRAELHPPAPGEVRERRRLPEGLPVPTKYCPHMAPPATTRARRKQACPRRRPHAARSIQNTHVCAPEPETSLAARSTLATRRPGDPATRCLHSRNIGGRRARARAKEPAPRWCNPQSAWPPLRG